MTQPAKTMEEEVEGTRKIITARYADAAACLCEACRDEESDLRQILSTLDRLWTDRKELRKRKIWCDVCEGSGGTGAHPHEPCSQCSGHGWIREDK